MYADGFPWGFISVFYIDCERKKKKWCVFECKTNCIIVIHDENLYAGTEASILWFPLSFTSPFILKHHTVSTSFSPPAALKIISCLGFTPFSAFTFIWYLPFSFAFSFFFPENFQLQGDVFYLKATTLPQLKFIFSTVLYSTYVRLTLCVSNIFHCTYFRLSSLLLFVVCAVIVVVIVVNCILFLRFFFSLSPFIHPFLLIDNKYILQRYKMPSWAIITSLCTKF